MRVWSHEDIDKLFTGSAGRAVRLVREHQGKYPSQWAAIVSIAAKIGCTAEMLRRWARQAEKDSGEREELTTADRSEGGVHR